MTAATSPSLEDLVQGILPGTPRLLLHHPLLAYENGQEFLSAWFDAVEDKLDPFILVVEGSIPNEKLSGEGYWAGLGSDPETGQPIPTTDWVDRLSSKAAAVIAVGTCATYGGIPAMRNNPTGAMGLPDYLGWEFKTRAGIPIICLPGCPAQPDNITETILYVSLMLAGRAPMIELDEALRPAWLFNRTVHENCNRAAFYEQGDFARQFGEHKCMVKLGCKGPVVKCNVGVRGWVRGRGGCPNVGGICIGCTMPGFPDRFQPFMESAYPVRLSANVARFTYGPLLRMMRKQGIKVGSKEPAWRRQPAAVGGGHTPRWQASPAPAPEYEIYQAGGRPARRFMFATGDRAWVEVHQGSVLVGWTSALDAPAWLESLHDLAESDGSALGLVILGKGDDPRGDLTWRETREILSKSAVGPTLVRVELGPMSTVWTGAKDAADGSAEVAATGTLETSVLAPLMASSATLGVKGRIQEILSAVESANDWSRGQHGNG